MFESSAKSLDGLMEGNYLFLGNYDECLSIEYQNDAIKGQGQYALLELIPSEIVINIKNPIGFQISKVFSDSLVRIRTAVCTPSECSSSDIQQLFRPSKMFFYNDSF